MTDGQIKALFTMLEYCAQQVVEIRKEVSAIQKQLSTRYRQQAASLARTKRELNKLKAQRHVQIDVKTAIEKILANGDFAMSPGTSVEKQPEAKTFQTPDYWHHKKKSSK